MGGRSDSTVHTSDGRIRFTGNLSKVGGGFCLARTKADELNVPATAAGLLVEYESDEFCYKVTLTTCDLDSGANWQAALPRGATLGRTELLPWSAFAASWRGTPIPGAVLNPEQINGVGLMCSIFENGAVVEDAP